MQESGIMNSSLGMRSAYDIWVFVVLGLTKQLMGFCTLNRSFLVLCKMHVRNKMVTKGYFERHLKHSGE